MRVKHFSILGIALAGLFSNADAQNVGVNISSPEYLLDIRGPSNDTGGVLNLANQDLSHFLRFFSGRVGDSNPFIWWREGDPLRFAVGDGIGSFTERMRIRSGGFVGINNILPQYPLEVNQPSGVMLLSGSPVILGEYTGTNQEDVIGIKGYSRPSDYYGIGGVFEGGYIGVEGRVYPDGANIYIGARGLAESYSGTGTLYGIYGQALGGALNWAGYFGAGDVHVQNKLGVGTLLPGGKVDIRHYSSLSSPTLLLYENNAADFSRLQFQNASGNKYWHLAGLIDQGLDANSRLNFYHSVNGDLLSIAGDGRVGIGTTNPGAWLDIAKNSSFNLPHLTLRETDIDYARMNFKMGVLPYEWSLKALPAGVSADADFLIQFKGETTDGTKLQIKGTGQVAIPEGLDASYSSHGYLMLGASGAVNVLLDNNEILARNNGAASSLSVQRDGGDLVLCELENGRVRIGTTPAGLPTDPAYLLAIGGKAICEELKVQLQASWPDYVFSKNYKLTPLLELEHEINEIGHLPGVPSAEEIHADGLEIGAMQRIMMEKIEELTIYMIELKKENEMLAREIARINQNQ